MAHVTQKIYKKFAEFNTFLGAILFYTRIPLPHRFHADESILPQTSKYLPIIGWLVGGFQSLIFLATHLFFPNPICILFALLAGILITGGLHEDGFIDVCDAFGGGLAKDDILRIMKDSRVGAFGVIGYVLLFFLKFELLATIANKSYVVLMLVFIAAASLSRLSVFIFMQSSQYIRIDHSSKSKLLIPDKCTAAGITFAVISGILPLLFFKFSTIITLVVILYFTKLVLRLYFNKKIGGYTGDCLGAVQQISELMFYVTFAVL